MSDTTDIPAKRVEDASGYDGTVISEYGPWSWVLVDGDAHGYRAVALPDADEVECRRIEWRYLDEEEVAPCAT